MKAVILSGGKGTRLKPLTDHTPKPMLLINDKPHLEYVIKLLQGHGITDIVFSTGYLHSQIVDHFGDGSEFGVSIQYKEDGEIPLGTAGAIRNCEELLDDEDFLVFNGDILTNIDLTSMIEEHKANRCSITIALTTVDDASQYGLAIRDSRGTIQKFIEKPVANLLMPKLVNAGVYIVKKEVLSMMMKDKYIMFETDVFPYYAGNDMYGFVAYGSYWLDIGTHERYKQANYDVKHGTFVPN